MTTNQNNRSGIERRKFLQIAWSASILGLVGQAGINLMRFLKPRSEPGSFGNKVVAGQVSEFVPGTVSRVQKGRFYISRLEDGGMLALWQQCTHLGCTVPWREDESQFHCPCHSSIFNRQGEVISGPAPRPLDIFPIEIENGQIIVDTGKPIHRDSLDSSQLTYI